MKLTEEHRLAIDQAFPKAHNRHPARLGAQWAIEKFGGIQWNKYPETKPTEDGKYMVCLKDYKVDGTPRYQWAEGWWGPTPNVFEFYETLDEWMGDSNVTHWAHINLPNEEGK
jgi:hypothetical protein